LLNLGFLDAELRGWSHMAIVANPKAEALFRRQGWKSVSPTLFDEAHQIPFVAMVLDLSHIRDSSRRFIHKFAELDYRFELSDEAPAARGGTQAATRDSSRPLANGQRWSDGSDCVMPSTGLALSLSTPNGHA